MDVKHLRTDSYIELRFSIKKILRTSQILGNWFQKTKLQGPLLVILAKQPVLCWLFWQNSRFFAGYFGKTVGSLSLLKKKLGRLGSWISGKNLS